MRYARLAICLLPLTVFAIAGCDRKPPASPAAEKPQPAVESAQANLGGPSGEAEFNYYLKTRLQKPVEQATDQEREQVRDELEKLDLVAKEAERLGIANDPEITARTALDRKSVLAQALIRRHLAENPITDEELRAEYESQVAQSPKNEYKARHILLESEEAAREVIKQLNEGADFAELSKEESTGPSAPTGGDLGWFTPDRMVKPFADAVAALEPGTYTKDPVQTQFGWHVILAEEQRPATAPPFEEIKEQLRPAVEQKRVERLVNGLR